MNELINFLNRVYAQSEKATSTRDRWTFFSQAYGAVRFFQQLYPKLADKATVLWAIKYYDKFMKLWNSSAN